MPTKFMSTKILIRFKKKLVYSKNLQKNADLLTIPSLEVIKGCVNVVLGGLPGFLLKTCSEGADVVSSIVFGS